MGDDEKDVGAAGATGTWSW